MQYVGLNINFEDLEPANVEIEQFLPKLKCTKCGHTFGQNEFFIAIFLNGLILCQRNEEYLYGITCPICYRTLVEKGDLQHIEALKKNISFLPYSFFDTTYIPKELSYYATPLYFIQNVPEVQDLEIYYSIDSQDSWNGSWDQKCFNEIMYEIIERNPELQNMYRTYVPNIGSISGFYASLFWFKEPDSIVELENVKNLKIFPRYHFKSEIIDKIEHFSWHNRYYRDFLYINDNDAFFNKNETPDPKETHFDLISILLNRGTGFEISESVTDRHYWFCDLIFHTDKPFYGKESINTELLNIDKKKQQNNNEKLIRLYEEIEGAANKDYVKRYSSEYCQEYIEEYIELIQKKDFTYSSIFKHNLKYLRRIYDIHRKEVLNEAKYAFYPEGPTWTITFDEETIRGLRGKGFEYLYHLVSNQHKSFSPEDLNALDGINTESIAGNNTKGVIETGYGSNDSVKASKPTSSPSDMISGDAVGNLKSEYQKLKAEKERAEESNDPILIQEAEKQFDEFVDYYAEYFSVGGRVKKFKDDNKVIKDRIAVNIKRALERIKKSKPNIWKHFDAYLTPIYSSDLCYRPEKEIDWKCK